MTRCPACLSEATRPAWRVGAHEFDRCRDCATVFLHTLPDGVAEVYADEGYFRNPDYDEARPGEARGYRNYVDDREFIEAKFDEVLARIEELGGRGRLLDVGAGPGFLVARAAARGWDACGVDLNEWAAAYARDVVGVDVRETTLDAAGLDEASFDAVTLMDLVEHVGDPDALLAECAHVTRPGGILAALTPDAGSPVSRALGRRWPEVQRAPEHVVLYSVRGLATLLARHGYETLGWHSVGKESTLATLAADVAPVAPALVGAVARALEPTGFAKQRFTLDPRTKFVLYARRDPLSYRLRPTRQARLRGRQAPVRPVEESVHDDLEHLARAERLSEWMFDQFRPLVRGRVAEIGAGIGTFSGRLLEQGVDELLLVEPDEAIVATLRSRFGEDPRVRIVTDTLPGSETLAAEREGFDLVLCQNVLEHIRDDAATVEELAAALRPGGALGLLVPAGPALYGRADAGYGHMRRYTPDRLRALAASAGLQVERLTAFNALGILGWVGANRGATAISERTLKAYEALLRVWRPVEERLRPAAGLSLVMHARKPS